MVYTCDGGVANDGIVGGGAENDALLRWPQLPKKARSPDLQTEAQPTTVESKSRRVPKLCVQ